MEKAINQKSLIQDMNYNLNEGNSSFTKNLTDDFKLTNQTNDLRNDQNTINIEEKSFISSSGNVNMLEKCTPLYEKNVLKTINNFEEILENKKLMNLINDREINEANLQKELDRIDKDYDKDIQEYNLIEEYSKGLLHNLDFQNKQRQRNLDKEFKLEILSERINKINESNNNNNNTNSDKIAEDDIDTIAKENLEVMSTNKNISKLKNKNILNLDLVIKSITAYEKIDFNSLSKDEEKQYLLDLKILLLNDKKISKIENLDIFEGLSELYLQRNFIIEIENFKHLKNLQILSLHNNFIKEIKNLSHLQSLKILDLSDNIIESFDVTEFPKNLNYLYLFDNLFYDKIDIFEFRYLCITTIPSLVKLDYLIINEQEKIFLPGFNIKKPDSNYNYNLKRKLKHISEHYNQMRKDRKSALNDYLDYLNNSSIYLNLNTVTDNSGSYTENNSINNSTTKSFSNINQGNNDNTTGIINMPSEGSQNKAYLSTNASSAKAYLNPLNYPNSNQSLMQLANEIISEEENIIKKEEQENINSSLSDKRKSLNSDNLLITAKMRSQDRKKEFQKDFYLTSKEIQNNLDDIKHKFKNFQQRYDRVKLDEIEAKIKEKMNFTKRISDLDGKLKDVELLSKSLCDKIEDIKSQNINNENYGFFNI